MSLFTGLLSFLKDEFSGAEKVIAAAIHALAISIEQNGGSVLVSAAASAVAAAETTGGSGKDKLAAAQAAVISALEGAGITVVMNAVNGAIEAAVAQQKANVATPTA